MANWIKQWEKAFPNFPKQRETATFNLQHSLTLPDSSHNQSFPLPSSSFPQPRKPFPENQKDGKQLLFNCTLQPPPVFNIKASLNTKNSPTIINPLYSPENSPVFTLQPPALPKNYKDGKPRKTSKKPTGNIQAQKTAA